IMYNEGISHLGLLIDLGAELDIVDKSGAWYSYGDLRLGQGKENAKIFLLENPDVTEEINSRLRVALELPMPGSVQEEVASEETAAAPN
ncbi:MAG TPA: recombinase RecA, partial [Longimicrobiales bacterium]